MRHSFQLLYDHLTFVAMSRSFSHHLHTIDFENRVSDLHMYEQIRAYYTQTVPACVPGELSASLLMGYELMS